MFRWLFGRRDKSSEKSDKIRVDPNSPEALAAEIAKDLAEMLEDVGIDCGLSKPVMKGNAERVNAVGYVAGFVDAATQELVEGHDALRRAILHVVFLEIFGQEDSVKAFEYYKRLENDNDPVLVKNMMRGGTEYQGLDDEAGTMSEWTKICLLFRALR